MQITNTTSEEEGYCGCYPGYWGTNCSNECAGGVGIDVCNGHGRCNPVTGQCSCNDRFIPNSTCNECKDGYIGVDCSVVILTEASDVAGHHTAATTTGAMLVTFDGAHYKYNGLGEHILWKSLASTGKKVFVVHIRNVVASSGALGVAADAFAFTCAGHTLEVYGGDTKSSIVWDQRDTDIFEPLRFAETVVCERIRLNRYRIRSDSGDLTIDIEIVGRFVYTTFVVATDVCRSSTGLLSSCSGDPHDDFVSKDSAVLIATGDKATLSQTTIHSVFGRSYRVAAASSLFSRGILQSTLPAGTGLYFAGCSVSTVAPLYTFSASDVTFEVRFKPASVSTHGVIFCYDHPTKRRTTTSFLVANGTIAVDYANVTRATNLQVEIGHWYMLSIVWQPNRRILLLYLTNVDGTYFKAKITFSSTVNVLIPGGRVTLGQWRGNMIDSERLRWDFHGIVDTFRIWNERRETLDIRTSAWTFVDGMVSNWYFNEGDGNVAFDSVAGLEMRMATIGHWTHATWVVSDVALSVPESVEMSAYGVLKQHPWAKRLKLDAEDFCQRVIYKSGIIHSCGAFNDEVTAAFYEQCVYDSIVGRGTQHSFSVAYIFLQRCSFLGKNVKWHKDEVLCRFYTRPDLSWKGVKCDKRCVSGTWLSSNKCVCREGFWGTHCEKRCTSVCDGTACDSTTGRCRCAANWNHDCSNCAIGWTGLDCSSAVSNVKSDINNDSVCAVYSHASYIMFDGQSYILDAAGEFVFMETAALKVYVRQGPCGSTHSYCVTQIAIRFEADTIVIHAPYNTDVDDYIVFVNGTVLDFTVHATVSKVQLDKYPSSTLQIVVANGAKLLVKSYPYYLTLESTIQKDMCNKATGVCGNCDGDIDNDFPKGDTLFYRVSDLTTTLISTVCAGQWSAILDVGFVYVYPDINYIEPRKYSTSGYSLYFRDTGATSVTSGPLTDVFESESEYVTIEVRFRLDKVTRCVVIGYTRDQVFTVRVGATFILTMDGHYYAVDITPTTGWQHLTIVYRKTTGATTVYHIDQSGTISKATLSIKINLFVDGGLLSIGREAPRLDTKPDGIKRFSTFTGQIDELRLWSRQLSLEYVLQSSSRIINAEFTHLGAQWTFAEGSGYTATDSVSGILLYISRDSGPMWVLSNAGVMITTQLTERVSGGVLPFPAPSHELSSLCVDIVLVIAKHCSALGESLTQLFTRQCIADVSRDPTRKAVITTVVTYASYCNILLRPPGLVNALCSADMSLDFSRQYICVNHDHCRFGSVDVFTGQCVCDIGYWGRECSSLCPGGPVQPCNGRGRCRSTTGECECDTRWLDSSNCTECKEGWSGIDCSRFTFPDNATRPYSNTTTAEPPVNETEITNPQRAAIFGQGHVLTFDSHVVFTLAALGEFHLLRSTELHIQVKTVGCYDQSVCIEAIAISYGGHQLVVRSGYTSKEQPHVWYNDKHIDSGYATFVKGVFQVTHNATFVVNVHAGSVAKLMVKQVHGHLSVTLVVSYTECSDQDSVLGDCGEGAVITADSYGKRWRVAPNDSLFGVIYVSSVVGETNTTLGGGHCVYFDSESSLSSGVLTDVFDHTSDLSLEFHLRAVSLHGVVISYGVTSSFSLYLEETIRIHIEGVVYDTSLTVSVDQWCKVTVVWHASSKVLSVYVINERGVIITSDMHVKYYAFLKRGGTLVLGKAPTMKIDGFVGEIDEIVVWHKAMLYQDIHKAWIANHYGRERDIAALWKFDYGEGVTVHEIVRSNHLQWAVYSWSSHQPLWRFSMARLEVLDRKKAFFFSDDALAISANEKCARMMAVIQPSCFDAIALSVYVELCVQDVAASGRLDVSLHVVVTVADMCMAEKDLPHWPAQSLCNEYTPGVFPYYVGPHCEVCYFGTDEIVAESCGCRDGYWGSDCSRLCPGGHLNSCRYVTVI